MLEFTYKKINNLLLSAMVRMASQNLKIYVIIFKIGCEINLSLKKGFIFQFGRDDNHYAKELVGSSGIRITASTQVGFLGSQRVDGKLILPEAIKTLTMKV